jgi:site-specific DNA-methyltransferase (adenine-specific)
LSLSPYFQRDGITLYHGDCLTVLPCLSESIADAVITDPPYSSGGLFHGDRTASTDSKYTQSEHQGRRPDFVGDNRDQRSWRYWCHLWMAGCLRVTKPAGYLLTFSDWRQLPTATDALQAAGWIWRGVIGWDKTEAARSPHTGYFRHQCEYVAWGTKGASKRRDGNGPWPGCYRVPVRQADKHHQTGKPTDLMRSLVRCVPQGGLVLDAFAGSGTTLVAATMEGRKAIGIEIDEGFCELAARRLEALGAQAKGA